MAEKVIVVPYDSNWPIAFEEEAERIRNALGINCRDIHHIGSTSVYGLKAKPIIDMLPVVKNLDSINIEAMRSLGYEAKGEAGVAFRSFFQKTNPRSFNVHIYQTDDPEITRHLEFRDWLRDNDEDLKRYELIKVRLADKFPLDLKQYCMGKSAFVDDILIKTGYEGYRLVQALTDSEWAAVKSFRKGYDFNNGSDSLVTADHARIPFIFYKNTEIAGYSELALNEANIAHINSLIIAESFRHQGLGTLLLGLLERWLKRQGYQTIMAISTPESYSFYLRRGYRLVSSNHNKCDPKEIEMQKTL